MTCREPPPPDFVSAFLGQSLDHALLFFDAQERIVWASPGSENMLGVAGGGLVGLNTCALFIPEDVAMGIPAHEFAIARSRGHSEDDRWMQRPDGSRFWATGVAYALRDGEGALLGYGKVLRNRTDWMEQQSGLRNQVIDLLQQAERKNRMISIFAHELRGPLAPLVNAAQILRESESANEYSISLIERQVDFMSRLIDDLMEATSVHVGKVQLRLERLSLQELLQDAVDAARNILERKGQVLNVLLPPGAVMLEGDPTRLQQVFSNLLSNASKYSPRGGRIWLKATTEDADAVVRVEDDGIGIPPAMLTHIFDLFAQVHAPKSPEGGVGIGLSLVKDLVSLHGGSVQANSDGVGKGSVFIVRLPALAAV